ncbi:uncharacterized protein LOC119692509 isoform X2 [Plutella xylostella]|uniref:uncharacterized protein LOC119692509 isoform X2 n=1 Tax=Plutella xylostella TaxID=51655 RepID=UPI002032E6A7|nr:uncharacterized protein LOC119692509 isoform X2 [Plutella xylostella]
MYQTDKKYRLLSDILLDVTASNVNSVTRETCVKIATVLKNKKSTISRIYQNPKCLRKILNSKKFLNYHRNRHYPEIFQNLQPEINALNHSVNNSPVYSPLGNINSPQDLDNIYLQPEGSHALNHSINNSPVYSPLGIINLPQDLDNIYLQPEGSHALNHSINNSPVYSPLGIINLPQDLDNIYLQPEGSQSQYSNCYDSIYTNHTQSSSGRIYSEVSQFENCEESKLYLNAPASLSSIIIDSFNTFKHINHTESTPLPITSSPSLILKDQDIIDAPIFDNSHLNDHVLPTCTVSKCYLVDGNQPNHSIVNNNNDISDVIFDIPKEVQNLTIDTKNDKILPLTSKNISPTAIDKNSALDYVEGTFIINNSLYNVIVENNKLVEKFYPYVIKTLIHNYVNNTCTFNIRYKSYKKKYCQFKIVMECIHRDCKKVKVLLKTSDYSAEVKSNSLNFSHKSPKTGWVTGVEREILKRRLYNDKALNVKNKDLNDCLDEKFKKTKKLGLVKSDEVYRKARSEALAINDRSNNDLLDLLAYQSKHASFVQRISMPFQVIIFSLEQLQVLIQAPPTMLHFDATGSVVRKPKLSKGSEVECKRVLYYCGVVNIENRILPIFSMISGIHTTVAIYQLLMDFKYFCIKQNFWPAFNGVVSDFSFANLNALAYAFNNCRNLKEYINHTYDLITGKITMSEEYVPIYLCVAHFMKMMSQDVKKHVSDSGHINYILDMLGGLMQVRNLEEIDLYVRWLYIFFNSKYESSCVKEAETSLCNFKDTIDVVSENTNDNIEFEDKNDPLFRNNKFFFRYNDLISKIDIDSEVPNTELNVYYNPTLFDIILKKYLTVTPLWSNILKKERVSNASVENFFGTMKALVLNKRSYLKCTQFIRLEREYILAKFKEFTHNIPKKRLTKAKEDEETWERKRPRKSITHFDGKHLRPKKTNLLLKHDKALNIANIDHEPGLCKIKIEKGTDMNIDHEPVHPVLSEIKIEKDTDFKPPQQKNIDYLQHRKKKKVDEVKITDTDIKSPQQNVIDNLQLHNNGLVRDPSYYITGLERKYYVSVFDKSPDLVKELDKEDFETLSGTKWLSNIAVDHCLAVLNQNNTDKYHILSVNFSSNLFSNKIDLTDEHIQELNTRNMEQSLIFPILLQNHFTLVHLSNGGKKMTCIDPKGNEVKYVNKYGNVIKKYFKHAINLKVLKPKHIIQSDGHNCGVYVIMFIEKIITKGNLNDKFFTPQGYRSYLQHCILGHSDCIKDICYICGRSVLSLNNNKTTWKCTLCQRTLHNDCISPDRFCMLCAHYKQNHLIHD